MEVSRARKMARPIVIEKPPEQPLLLPPRFAPLPPSFICTPYCFVESEIAVPARSYRSKEKEEGEKKRNKVCPSKRCDGLCHPCYPCFSFIALYQKSFTRIDQHLLFATICSCCKSFFSSKMSISNVIVTRFSAQQLKGANLCVRGGKLGRKIFR